MTTTRFLSAGRRLSRLAALILTLVILTALIIPVSAVSYPRAIDYIADEAGILTDETSAGIKKINRSLATDTGCRIAVCTVKTTGAIDIAEYAKGVFSNWKLGEGALLLFATEDNNYYILQSTGVESVLSGEALLDIRDSVLEPDFAAGNYDHAAAACVNKLAASLTAGMPAVTKDQSTAPETHPEAKATTAGSVIVTLLKIILWIVIIAVVAFVALFIAALFNDTAADILANTIFRKNHQQSFHMAESDYDERLYGNRPQQQYRGQQQRPYNGSSYGYDRSRPAQRPQQNGSQNNRQRSGSYYNPNDRRYR